MSIKIMFSPRFPKPVFEVAIEMTPPGFELVPVDATGPQFLDVAGTDTLVSLTSNRIDHARNALAVNYRLDTPSAREFLGQFVPLP